MVNVNSLCQRICTDVVNAGSCRCRIRQVPLHLFYMDHLGLYDL